MTSLAFPLVCPGCIETPRERLGCARRMAFGLLFALALGVCAAAAPTAPVAPANAGTAPGAIADLTLEQLMDVTVDRVYGASRHMQKVTQAPSAVSIVSGEEVTRYGWRTLGDLLRSVRGLYVANDFNYSYVGVRGFLRPGDYDTRLLVLVDGHRMNDNIYDGAYVGPEAPFDPATVDRVEVIRGPSSSIYGSSAFFGVINLVTKRGAQLEGGRISADLGSFGSREGSIAYGKKFGAVDWVASASYFDRRGRGAIYFPEFDPRRSALPGAANDGIAQNADGERVQRIATSLAWRDVTLSAFASRRGKNVPTASFGTIFNDPREHTDDRRGYVDAKLDHAFEAGRLLARVFYDQFRYAGIYPYDVGLPEAFLSTDSANGEWLGTEWQFTAPVSDKLTTIVGGEWRESFREDQAADYGTPADFEDHRDSRSLGLFAQAEYVPAKAVRLSGGLRYDHYYGSFGGTVNPRLAAIFSLNEVSTLKLLYGRAYRAPNPYERYYYPLQALRAPLGPERVHTYEVVWERYWQREYRLSISGYTYSLSNLVTQAATPAGDIFFENASATRATGGEVEFEAKYESGWEGRASVAHQRAQERAGGGDLSNSPRTLAKLNLAWAPPKGLCSVGVEVQAQSSARTLAGGSAPAFALANLHLAATRLPGRLEASLTISNVFNSRAAYPAAEDHAQAVLEQPGRGAWLKVTHRF